MFTTSTPIPEGGASFVFFCSHRAFKNFPIVIEKGNENNNAKKCLSGNGFLKINGNIMQNFENKSTLQGYAPF